MGHLNLQFPEVQGWFTEYFERVYVGLESSLLV